MRPPARSSCICGSGKRKAQNCLIYLFFFSLFSFPRAGKMVLLWRRGANVLTAASIMVTRDERLRLVDGYNLEIADLEPQDAGDYVCQISDKVNKDQIHTVEILGKPRPLFCLMMMMMLLAILSAQQHKLKLLL